MILDAPVRIDHALATGAMTREMAQSSYYLRLFPRVAVPRNLPLTMELRAHAAGLVHEQGVVAGVAAAALHRAVVAPLDPVVDLVVDVEGVRGAAGLRRRRLSLGPAETVEVCGTRVTTPARTAYDVARWLPRAEAVVVLDALARATRIGADEVRAVRDAHPDDRDRTAVEPALSWLDPRSPGPAASRLRVALLARGLPRPCVEQRLTDRDGVVSDLALAWPETRTGLSRQRGVAAAAREIGWEVVEQPDPSTDGVDGLAARLTKQMERWDPPRMLARPRPIWLLPSPPDDDGWFDDGRSRLVALPR
ncbi:hypothetical protein [Actinomycetospora termitidis]|uniref:AbiEi antitoxin C-terminal domain-containing protein n=1 Tax=Actinomycetospora termitidis TaxID=3053470 RepID=A0ABT7M9I1_9PSEU|nr:hypothetical protein [Actinomycetospora sp. Odt1-22]MDL5157106.1 hypothetical protein [Actinomycetospora sp. Odt1-22]